MVRRIVWALVAFIPGWILIDDITWPIAISIVAANLVGMMEGRSSPSTTYRTTVRRIRHYDR